MSAYESDYFGLFAFGEGRQYLVDRKAAKTHNGPSQLPAWRFGDLELLSGGIFRKQSRNLGGQQSFPGLAYESPSCYFLARCVGHFETSFCIWQRATF